MDAQDRELDAALAQLRARPPEVTQAFMETLLSDALHAQPRSLASCAPAPDRVSRGQAASGRGGLALLWQGLVAGLGGRGVLAGLAGAAVLGLCIGYVGPEGLLAETIDISDVGYELVPAAEFFLTEI